MDCRRHIGQLAKVEMWAVQKRKPGVDELQLTLHVTNQCNLNCNYCFVEHGPERMPREVAFAAIKLAMMNTDTTGILFYGGEPLLERQLIHDVVDYTKSLRKKTGHTFYYKITTNGTLLDEEFLKFAKDANLTIGFSCDGIAQDDCRKFHDGAGSLAVIEPKIPLLLKYQPYAIGMSVVDPATIDKASKIIKYLFDKGFKYLHMGVNYCKTAPWSKERFSVLEREYKKIAKMYIKWTRAEEKFYFSSFDMKILSHLKSDKYNADRSRMGMNQPSVAPNGKVYSISKHLNNPVFEIGDVFSGIDAKKHKAIFERGLILAKPCQKCAIKSRCNYAYDNLNSDGTEIIDDVSAVQCTHERVITPIADNVAETLYKEQNALFIHKHYNDLYPFMSLVEDGF